MFYIYIYIFLGSFWYLNSKDYFKKSGQIPAFGNWDYANELPITQYFECARQAGLIRYSSSSGDSSDPYLRGDLYAVDHHPQKPYRAVDNPLPARKVNFLFYLRIMKLIKQVFALFGPEKYCSKMVLN